MIVPGVTNLRFMLASNGIFKTSDASFTVAARHFAPMRGLFIAAALFGVIASAAQGQNTGKLYGTVLDDVTGEALVGANVVLYGTIRGAATDDEGVFTLLGVPVGSYEVVISYVGFQPVELQDVEINAGYTRDLGTIRLEPGLELEAVVVQYERPLLQKDAVGPPRIVTAAELENLPVRGVNEVMAIQPGVSSVEGREEIHARGGRSGEVTYFIDGVKLITDDYYGVGAIPLPQAAIQEQEMLIGNISARYGDVMSGVVNVTTKSGRPDFFGSLEALTSRGLDAYGTSIFSGSVGGPVTGEKLTFFVSAEFSGADDGHPRAVRNLQVDPDEIERLENSPQALAILLGDGSTTWVELPGTMEAGASLPLDGDGNFITDESGAITASDGTVIQLPPGATLASSIAEPLNAWEVVDPSLFSFERNRLSTEVVSQSGTANLTFRPADAFRIRIGGRASYDRTQASSQRRRLFSPEASLETENTRWQAYLNFNHYLSDKTFYQIQIDIGSRKWWEHDNRFSKDIEDLIYYGDIDHPANSVQALFRKPVVGEDAITFEPRYADGSLFWSGESIADPPGGLSTSYGRSSKTQLGFSASATTQIGIHQLEIGGEFEQLTNRYWFIGSGSSQSLAGYIDDSGSCSIGTCGPELEVDVDGDGIPEIARTYEEIPESVIRADYYGFNAHGTQTTGSEDLLAYLDGSSFDLAPWKPTYLGGYVQDKIEFLDVVLNLGLRVDQYDNNSLIYSDPFSRVPIVRANTVTDRPETIGDDFAVYFDGDTVAGYRNRDGEYFDPGGEQVAPGEVLMRGTPRNVDYGGDQERRRAAWDSVFEDYDPRLSIMPRIGVSFPVTDRSLLFGRYGVVTQRPSTNNYASLQTFLNLSSFNIPNPALKPEKTIEYEIGFRQRISERMALTLSGFFRQIKDLVTYRLIPNAYPAEYSTAQNADFGTVKGLEFSFDLRRLRHVSATANYSLSLAEGLGSAAPSGLGGVVGLGVDPMKTIVPLKFDQRHRFNLSLDLRFGEDEGPSLAGIRLLENLGINVLVQAASGFPYTAIIDENPSAGGDNIVVGRINSSRTPATGRLDVRIDRAIRWKSGASVSVFLWIQNVLDSTNIFSVYRNTGLPDDNGFLATELGAYYLENQLRPETAAMIYSHRYRNPNNFGIPRMIRLGAKLTF